MDLYAALEKYQQLRSRKSELEEELKTINGEIETTNDELVKMMVESETQKISRGGYTFSLNKRVFARPKEGQKERLFSWLKRWGYGDMVKQTVNANVLSSQVTEWQQNDGKLPGMVSRYLEVYEKVTVGMRRT